MVEFKKFIRPSASVSAVQLTEENLAEVAKILKAPVQLVTDDKTGKKKVFLVLKSGTIRGKTVHNHCFPGDWITRYRGNYQKYDNQKFQRLFRSPTEDQNERFVKVFQLVTSAMSKQDAATYNGDGTSGMHDIAMKTTREILAVFDERE